MKYTPLKSPEVSRDGQNKLSDEETGVMFIKNDIQTNNGIATSESTSFLPHTSEDLLLKRLDELKSKESRCGHVTTCIKVIIVIFLSAAVFVTGILLSRGEFNLHSPFTISKWLFSNSSDNDVNSHVNVNADSHVGINVQLPPEDISQSYTLPLDEMSIPSVPTFNKNSSSVKDRLEEINMQSRGYIHLGKPEDGFVRINTENNRVEKRRRNMRAFDRIRVDYCGNIEQDQSLNKWQQIFDIDHPSSRVHGKAKEGQYPNSKGDLPDDKNRKPAKLKVRYAKNSIDYAVSYNNRKPYKAIKVPSDNGKVNEEYTYFDNLDEKEYIDKREAAISAAGMDTDTYEVNRYLCEREWGIDAPRTEENAVINEYGEATVTIERQGPFFGHGNYDWHSIIDEYGIASMQKDFAENDDIYVLGTFFLPVFPNGTVISYPPLHVHHTHLYPYSGGEMSTKINILNRRFQELVKTLKSSTPPTLGDILQAVNIKPEEIHVNLEELSKLSKDFLENNDEVIDELMNHFRENGISHHVILQGHGDAECITDHGGSDCVLHLLEPGQGYRVHRSSGFMGNFEINDVRNVPANFDNYFQKLDIDPQILLEVYREKLANSSFVVHHHHDNITNETIEHADRNPMPNGGRSRDVLDTETFRMKHGKENEFKFYVDTGIIWTKHKKIETTFLQFGNPPIGLAWMTYNFPLDQHTNFMFYNYTNYFLGGGELSNFIAHTHMTYVDSLYVFKGDLVHSVLMNYLSKRNATIPYLFECNNETLSDAKKNELLQLVISSGAQLVCEGTKPTVVLYCNSDDNEQCIYRDRRFDFNCLKKVRLEPLETLTFIAFNRVREVTTGGYYNRITDINDKNNRLNTLAVVSSFGFHWAAHQHSFFRGDFVSDAAKQGRITASFGSSELDFLTGNYAPPSYFNYGSWEYDLFGLGTIEAITDNCKRNHVNISYEGFLPWENLYN